MAISYVGAGTPQDRSTTSGSTWVLGVPSGLAAGDLLLAFICGPAYQVANATAPSGWTLLIGQANFPGSSSYLGVYQRTATASEPATYTWNTTDPVGRAGVIVAYRGAAVPTIFATARTTGTTATAPSVTPTQANNYVLSVFGDYNGYNNSVFSAPLSDYAVRYNTPSVANSSAALEVIDRLQSTASASPQPQVNDNSTSPSAYSASLVIPIYNVAPNAPTLTSPATGASLDRTLAQTFVMSASDNDPGDTVTAVRLAYRVQGSTGAFTVITQTGSSTSVTVAANTFADSTQYEWQGATADSQNVWGPYSASSIFLAATPQAAPSITVPAANATVTGPSTPLTFAATNVDASQWRVMGDTSGAANSTVVLAGATSGDPSLRTFTVDGLTDNTAVHLQVRIRYQGLWSPWADRRVSVAFTLPAVPTVTLTMLSQSDPTNPASLLITITNPTPSGGQPAVVSHEVYLDDGRGSEKRAAGLAPGATYLHRTPAAGREYSAGPVRVAAVAASGAKSFGVGVG